MPEQRYAGRCSFSKADFSRQASLGTSVSHPCLASGCFFTLRLLCNCCAVNQVTELIQVTKNFFIYRVVLNTGCFSYQNDARNRSAGAAEEAGPWDGEERKAVGIAGTGEEAAWLHGTAGSDGISSTNKGRMQSGGCYHKPLTNRKFTHKRIMHWFKKD